MTDRELFLDTASRIGRRIAAQAVWAGGACTWTMGVSGRAGRPGAGVYTGTAGIALFLAELHRLAPDPEVRRAAEGALAHALADPADPRTRFAFHSGRVGTAYAAARAGQLLGRDDLLKAAAGVLEGLAGHEAEDFGLDVIAGAAGAVPALLRLAGVLDRDLATRMAAALGESIIARAHVEPRGWAWGEAVQALHARRVCGLAHGAAGMGHALLELAHARGDARCRYGAEQAFAYERQFFDPAEENWLDLRHDLRPDERSDELRARVLAGDPALAYRPRFTHRWCHGAPGIALTRLRAYEVTGDEMYRGEAEAALAATLRSLGDEGMGHSLCHGLSGNAAVLLRGARVLGRPELRARAEAVGAEGAERFERAGRPWPCGTLGGVSDPGLMLGEAGIGYFHLQLYADDVPCILLPTAPGPAAPELPGSRDDAAARLRADAEAYFGRTLRVLRAAGDSADLLPPPDECARQGTAAATYDALCRRIQAEPDADARERPADAFRLERERYEMTLDITDFREEYLRALAHPEPPPVDWETAELRLAPHVRVVETAWDWDDDGDVPGEGGAAHLLYRAGNRIHARRLGPLAALVLAEVGRGPGGVEAIAARVAASFPSSSRGELAARVREQLERAHRARLVDAAPAPVPA